MTTALATVGRGLTVSDVLLLELPHIPEEQRDTIAWEFTGFPFWWAYEGNEWHPLHVFRRQLREFREGRTSD